MHAVPLTEVPQLERSQKWLIGFRPSPPYLCHSPSWFPEGSTPNSISPTPSVKPGKEAERRGGFPRCHGDSLPPCLWGGGQLHYETPAKTGGKQAVLGREWVEDQEGHGSHNAEGKEEGEPDPERLEQRASSSGG